MTDSNRDKMACPLVFSSIKCWKGKETKHLKLNPTSNPRKYRRNARWSMGSLHEAEMGKREIWWLQRVGTWWVWSTSICRYLPNTTLLLIVMSWLMQSLSGVSGLTIWAVHNPDKPSAVDWEAIRTDPALWQESCTTPCEFPDNVSMTFAPLCILAGTHKCQRLLQQSQPALLPTYQINPFLMLHRSFYSNKLQQISSIFFFLALSRF